MIGLIGQMGPLGQIGPFVWFDGCASGVIIRHRMSQAPVTKEMTLEIEVKLASDDLDRLRNAGYELKLDKPRHFEDNWLLDFPDEMLLKQGAALRVRLVNGTGTVTYKGIVKETHESRLKVREEIETTVTHPQKMIEL